MCFYVISLAGWLVGVALNDPAFDPVGKTHSNKWLIERCGAPSDSIFKTVFEDLKDIINV
jgi:hypothetical protein